MHHGTAYSVIPADEHQHGSFCEAVHRLDNLGYAAPKTLGHEADDIPSACMHDEFHEKLTSVDSFRFSGSKHGRPYTTSHPAPPATGTPPSPLCVSRLHPDRPVISQPAPGQRGGRQVTVSATLEIPLRTQGMGGQWCYRLSMIV